MFHLVIAGFLTFATPVHHNKLEFVSPFWHGCPCEENKNYDEPYPDNSDDHEQTNTDDDDDGRD